MQSHFFRLFTRRTLEKHVLYEKVSDIVVNNLENSKKFLEKYRKKYAKDYKYTPKKTFIDETLARNMKKKDFVKVSTDRNSITYKTKDPVQYIQIEDGMDKPMQILGYILVTRYKDNEHFHHLVPSTTESTRPPG